MDDYGTHTYQALADYGEPVVLRRQGAVSTEDSALPYVVVGVAATSVSPNEVPCAAAIRRFQPNELIGGIEQGDHSVIISNVEIATIGWPGPPRNGDMVLRTGNLPLRVSSVETVRVGTDIVRFNLIARGMA